MHEEVGSNLPHQQVHRYHNGQFDFSSLGTTCRMVTKLDFAAPISEGESQGCILTFPQRSGCLSPRRAALVQRLCSIVHELLADKLPAASSDV